jgi:hypothetical protein
MLCKTTYAAVTAFLISTMKLLGILEKLTLSFLAVFDDQTKFTDESIIRAINLARPSPRPCLE